MRIAVTGATGMVGTALAPFLAARGHVVIPVSRSANSGGITWHPERGVIDAAAFEGIDAVVHLAGENIAGARWTSERKRVLRDRRVVVAGRDHETPLRRHEARHGIAYRGTTHTLTSASCSPRDGRLTVTRAPTKRTAWAVTIARIGK